VSNPAALSTDDVRAIAELAKLHLTNDEIEAYADQLSKILGYFTLLQEVDTTDIPSASVLPPTSSLRPDTVLPALDPTVALRNAPDKEDNQFKVNVVLGDE
jgi:aspartyl-tRNA(Asn)/glutamyl-tRNA(Gln) amidotransferase subunit C